MINNVKHRSFGFIAALLLGDYTNDEYQDKKTKKIKLIIALCLLAIAAVWTLVKFY